jgi:Spy/CpxP family protein refolding chaperone
LVLAQDTRAKAKGQLPANWKKLGLTEIQRDKIYSIQADFRPKIKALEVQLKNLRQEERREMEKVLTDAQKARLKEIVESTKKDKPLKKEEPLKKDEKKPGPEEKKPPS